MISRFYTAIVLSIFPVFFIYAQTPLSQDAFIKQSLTTTLTYAQSHHAFQEYIYRAAQTSAQYDWNVFFNSQFMKGTPDAFFGLYDAGTYVSQFSGEVQKKLLFGSDMSLKLSSSTQENLPQLGNSFPRTQYGLSLDLNIKQPLIKNLFGTLNKNIEITAFKALGLVAIQQQVSLDQTIAHLATLYTQWAYSHRHSNLLKEQLKKAEKQYRLTQNQFKQNVIEKKQLNDTYAFFLQQKMAYQDALADYYSLTIQVYSEMNDLESIPDKGVLDFGKWAPVLSSCETDIPTLLDALTIVKTSGLNHQLMSHELDIQDFVIEYAKEQNKTELNAFIGTSIKSLTPTRSDRFSTFGSQKPFSFGIEWLPFKDKSFSKDQINIEESVKQQIIARQDTTYRQLAQQIRSLYHTLDYLKSQHTIATKALAVHIENEKLEKQEYNQGRQPSQFFILNAQTKTIGMKQHLLQLSQQQHNTKIMIADILDSFYTIYASIIPIEGHYD